MAAPSARRPGFSRRAQYGLFLGTIGAIGGVLLAVLLLVIAMIDPPGFTALRSLALDATSPITAGGRGLVRGVTGTVGAVGDYVEAGRQNDELRRQLAAARRQIIAGRAAEYENRRLKALLRLRDLATDEVVTARIVGSTFDGHRRLATLAAGSGDGVRRGQPVRGPDGLIGRVLEVGRVAARVLLVTDASSSIPVLHARSGIAALAVGRGDGTVDLKTLEVGINPFRRGDIVVTSGVGGLYPPGVPVAIVVRATRDRTVAKPIADPARLDYALVQAIYQPAAASAQQPLDIAAAEAPR